MNMKKQEIAGMIDHTILKATATSEDIRKLCAEAREYHFASVCVNPVRVALAAKELKGSGVKVCTVVGFPLGACTSEAKAFETKNAVENGAEEIDMVISVGDAKEGRFDLVEQDIAAVVKRVGSSFFISPAILAQTSLPKSVPISGISLPTE